MVARDWGLVFGGGKTGSMGSIARAVNQHGGRVVGVIPEFMKAKELAFEQADELIAVSTMHERKALMEALADAFVALPGGWGTLEEFMETVTLRQVDVLHKPCVLFNQDGFYDRLLQLFDQMVTERFNRPSSREMLQIASSVEEVMTLVEQAPMVRDANWFDTVTSFS